MKIKSKQKRKMMDGVMNLKMITWVEWMTMTALGRLE